jgi:hypothetical protein
MNIASTFIHLLKAITAFLVTAVGFLFSADGESETDSAHSSSAGGSLNYRTEERDDGTDPYGWYDHE